MKTEMRRLRVDGGFPLSWCCEDIKDEKGRQVRDRTVGRRVWGEDIGVAQWLLEARDGRLALISLEKDGTQRVHQTFPPPEGYDSPWHSDCTARARQVAEWYEEQAFNAALELCSIGRDEVPE